MKSAFRVKPYAHREYKFVVRAKIGGQWKRRYFRTEQEASVYAEEQNRLVEAVTATQPRGRNPSTGSPAAAITDYSRSAHDLSTNSPAIESAPEQSERVPSGEQPAQVVALKAEVRALTAQLSAAQQWQRELADARWEVLTLRADFLRGRDAAADTTARLAETEDRANAVTGERDQLRGMVLSLQKDLEQERLNVAAVDHRCRMAEQRANESERAAAQQMHADKEHATTLAQLNAAEESLRVMTQQFYAAEDRANASEASLRRTELRATASEEQLRTIQSQSDSLQEQLRTAGKELAARRTQILRLREQLARRLILPFGKMQQRIDDLTKVAPQS